MLLYSRYMSIYECICVCICYCVFHTYFVLIVFRVSARQSCLNSTEETSRKVDRPNVSQETIPVKSHPVNRSFTTESVDSESTMDIDTADSNTRSSILGDNGDSGNDCTVAIEDETKADRPIFIQSDVGDDIKGTTGMSSFNSSNNGEEANGMGSVNFGSKPESEKRVMTSSSVTKLKPLISPGFLGKRPRKVLNSNKDENALESVNGDLKAFSDVGKE